MLSHESSTHWHRRSKHANPESCGQWLLLGNNEKERIRHVRSDSERSIGMHVPHSMTWSSHLHEFVEPDDAAHVDDTAD
eukprot:5035599-Amphidinium_carterae.1